MNQTFKFCVSLLVIGVLFKLGYDRAAHEGRQDSISPPKFQASPSQLSYASPTSLLPRKSSFLINGVPAKVDPYISEGSLAEQTAKFESNLKSRGYKTSAQSLGKMKILSAMNENTRQFECAIMIPDRNSKRTFVIPAQLDLRHSPQPGGFNMPVYPNAQTYLHLESQDLGGQSENIIQLSEAGVPAVMSYYKSQLLQEGWQAVETPKLMYDPQYADQLVFVNGAKERWIYASKMEGRNQTMIFAVHNEK